MSLDMCNKSDRRAATAIAEPLDEMPRDQLTGDPARSFKVLFVVAFINLLVAWMAGKFHRFWAVQTPDATFTYPIRFKGEGVWLALAVLALILYWNRHLLRRVK
jgi:hypothetical protein